MADEGKREETLLALSLDETTAPIMSDPHRYVVQSRQMNLPFFNGSIDDMPYMFKLEIQAVLDGEIDWQNILARNLELKAKKLEEDTRKAVKKTNKE